MMDNCLETDCCMTSLIFGRKTLKPKVVMNTWKNTPKNEADPPSNRTEVSRVLVGRSWSLREGVG
jgi:hypothetical protein